MLLTRDQSAEYFEAICIADDYNLKHYVKKMQIPSCFSNVPAQLELENIQEVWLKDIKPEYLKKFMGLATMKAVHSLLEKYNIFKDSKVLILQFKKMAIKC